MTHIIDLNALTVINHAASVRRMIETCKSDRMRGDEFLPIESYAAK
jgi:hypothetical protein